LLWDPGEELQACYDHTISDVLTPFRVEFARSSKSQEGAPTLIPTDEHGVSLKSEILVLKDDVSVEEAADLLYRRETRQDGTGATHYSRPQRLGANSVLIEKLQGFEGVAYVLYVRIGQNIQFPTPELLARLAIASAKSPAGSLKRDGISYLINVKNWGLRTPLMPAYERAILMHTRCSQPFSRLARMPRCGPITQDRLASASCYTRM